MNEDDGVRRVEGGGARHAAEEKEKERGREGERERSLERSSRVYEPVSRLAGAYPGSDVSRRRSYELICGNQALPPTPFSPRS